MINKRLTKTVGLLLVIALSTSVISANSIESKQPLDTQQVELSAPKEVQKESPPALEAKLSDTKVQSQPQPQSATAPAAAAAAVAEAKQAEESSAKPAEAESSAEASNGKRKAKSAESSPPAAAAAAEQKPASGAGSVEEKADKPAATEAAKAKPDSAAKPSTTNKAASQKQSALSAKSGASKSKLPANLGTVTSTGSGGATHYMSKHDAYSAIAEKHGALAHDTMRKSDKRHMHSSGGNPFTGGIQKASGLGEMLNPFKGVTDSGLARTLGASMRSIMKSKYSVPAYVASALLGAVALMAFYESPISPLPVPALPNPPVGRFPPELPNISPNVQVPFRANQQQQNYNQRSLYANQPQQQQQQNVFFPGANLGQQAQQRQAAGSPVQNLAANLLASVGKPQQNAQRKSGIDYDPSTSRSLFGNNSPFPQKASAVNSPTNHQQRGQSGGFLSFFGLGADQHSAGHHNQMSGSQQIEPKVGQQNSQSANAAGSLSNSHVVNKVKSYFRAPSPTGSSSAAGISNSNPYDQYQRMSFVQALMKDTAFLPAFLTPGNRKSSSPVAATSSGSSAAASVKPAESSAGSNQQVAAAARMQTGNEGQLTTTKQFQQQQPQQTKSTGGYGIVRVAHALLESLGSGMAQRSNQPSERKSQSDESQSIAAATSLLSDLVSGYSANLDQQQQQQQQLNQQPQQQQQPQSPQTQQASVPQQATQQQQQQQSQSQAQQQSETPQAQARSDDDDPTIITADDQLFTAKKADEKAVALVRKTRSAGFEYPLEAQAEQQPSRAAQINNVIDFVADSYAHNRLLFNFVMNQVGLSQAVPYVEQILAPTAAKDSQ